MNIKKQLMRVSAIIVGGASGVGVAMATQAIDNDTLGGLPQLGSDIGQFLTKLAPGVGSFIIILGVFGGVAGIIYAIVNVVKRKVVA